LKSFARASKQIEDGAVTENYKLDRDRVVASLNAALATEIVFVREMAKL